MKTARFSLLGALLPPLLFLTSCLDYREELWINANGSGKIHATIAINSEVGLPPSNSTEPDEVETQLKALFAATEGAEVDSYQSYDEGKQRIYEFTVRFRDLKQLKPAIISGQGNIGAVFGDFEIIRIPENRLSVKRVVTLNRPDEAGNEPPEPADDGTEKENSLGGAIGKAFGGLMADAMLANYTLEYVTHFPTEIATANTTSIDQATQTATWRFPLSKASQGPVTMTAEIKRPGTWMIWVFAGLVVVVTAAILLPALRKKG